MLAQPDREDNWFFEHSALSFTIPANITTFQEAYEYTKQQIEDSVKWLVEAACLEDDLFEGEAYEFKGTSYAKYGVEFEFQLANGDIILYWLKPAFINLYPHLEPQ